MSAVAEILLVVVRGGPEYRGHGDPYTWAMTVTRVSETIGYVHAVVGKFTLADMREARDLLKGFGFRRLNHTRVNGRKGVIHLGGPRKGTHRTFSSVDPRRI
jgi:hypothetical protein